MRSAAVFVIVGVVLHFLVQQLVEEQFQSHAQFHAEFVTEVVLQQQLRDVDLSGRTSRTELTDRLRRDTVDPDASIYHITVWDPRGTVLAADDTDHLPATPTGYPRLLDRALTGGAFSIDGPAPYLHDVPVDSTLRTFVPFEVGRRLVVEVHQDWSPTLAASRRFSRTLDAGLFGGIVLLWILSLPIARQAGRRLHERARTDELTELHNRTALEEQLCHALDRVERTGACVALMFVDLDGFKRINDTLGHAPGDEALRQIAERLRVGTRAGDMVARFAGDEFVILLEDIDEVLAAQVARRMLDEIGRPLEGLGDVRLTASIGMAATHDATLEPDVLLRRADAAMYHVKDSGGNDYRVFDESLREQVARHNQLESQLRGASTRGELHLLYQPFAALDETAQDPVAVEALLRWIHPQLGAVGPDEFIPLAERNGHIESIGDWVIRTACWQLAGWQADLDPDRPFVVYVNLSPLQLTDRLLDVVDHALADSGADPSRLGFEITETAVLDNEDGQVMILLERLRQRGCRIALDDFGTGYSSLSRLRATPLDLLKLDGSFVNQRSVDGRERAILTAVSQLAGELELQLLAEGIETQGQLDAVTDLGFDLAQGYHLARPAAATTVPVWLHSGLPATARLHREVGHVAR